jgi:hypothetical protein
MGKCSGCGEYAHNIRTCPGIVGKYKTNNAVVKTLCKYNKSCLICTKKGHTFDTCDQLEKILPDLLYTESPSPIYPTASIEDAWIDVL